MTTIPKPALFLGLAGVLPFAFCALAGWVGLRPLTEVLRWDLVMVFYAVTILSFMSGCIWAFAAHQQDHVGYALSTLPALAGFFALTLIFVQPGGDLRNALAMFAGLFVLLLQLDRRAARRGQTPDWWMPLRRLLTTLVGLSLLIGALT